MRAVSGKMLNAANYGVPQNRDRVIIIGIRADLDREWAFPAETHSADRLFWDMYVTGEYMIRFLDGSVRYLTVLEAKRLQTFPDNFVIKGVWGEATRQIGNAVPILLAETMGHELMKILNTLSTHSRLMP